MARLSRKEFWTKQVKEQEEWIERHGSDEAGYIKRYGAKGGEFSFGEGGSALFQADHDALLSYRKNAGL